MNWTELTPLNPTNLNDLEARIAAADAAVVAGKLSVYNALVTAGKTPTSQAFADLVSAVNYLGNELITVRPGDSIISNNASAVNKTAAVYTVTKQSTVQANGTVRVRYTLNGVMSGGPGDVAYAKLYKNGVPIGTEYTILSYTTPLIVTQDVAVVSGDLIQVYAYRTGEQIAVISNLTIGISTPISVTANF